VRYRTAAFGSTLGLGLASLTALGLATLSGILLMLHYVPSVERAHSSVEDLLSVVPFGWLVRNLHRWSAHAAVLFALLHLLRTFLWGSYRGSHRRVWLLGVGLLLVTLATSYSGYLLPWDQDAYWTVTVGTSLAGYLPLGGDWLKGVLLGGQEVAQPALTRFFLLHVAALPALGLLLLGLHLFRLRRVGGLARPDDAKGPSEALVPASPSLLDRELALVLLVTVALLGVSIAFHATLGPPPDVVRPDNPPKAPWFLVGVQEMVSYSATAGGVVFPGLLLLVLFTLPWLEGPGANDGAPLRRRGSRVAVPAAVLVTAGAAVSAVLWWGDPQQGIASWINPASLSALAAVATALAATLCWRTRLVAFQSLLAGLLAALAVFTATGWFWRGPDWSLVYHPGPGAADTRVDSRGGGAAPEREGP
jgi:quinol-cytochrome oxidoreductase complex cytochrome b subunit